MAIFKRPDSRYWWMWLERPGLSGIRKSTRVLVDAPTPGERRDQKLLAEQIYRAQMGELARRRYRLPDAERPTITFVEYSRWYLENYTAHKRCAARERSMILNLKESFRGYHLNEIDRDLVVEKRTERLREVKASTVNRETDVLKHMLAMAVPRYLENSPIAGLPRLRVKKAKIRIFTEAEERSFFAATQTLEEAALMLLARDTIMRMSDVKNLEWSNYHAEYIDVVDPKVEPYIVPLTERAREILELLPRRGRYVFPRRQRGPGSLSTNTIHRMFVEICRRAKIPQGRKRSGVTFHSLRHTGTTRALERGVPIRAVQAAGGWQSLKQLERYGHVTDESLKMFRDRVGGEGVKFGFELPTKRVH